MTVATLMQAPTFDVEVVKVGMGFYQFTPMTGSGSEWIEENVPDWADSSVGYSDSGTYACQIANGMLQDGLSVSYDGEPLHLQLT